MLKIQDSSKSQRITDDNGYLIIKNNPIARAGVFDYLLKEIEPNISGDEGEKIVKVYRPLKPLIEVKEAFANKPIMENHKFLGKLGDSKQADGAIGSEISSDDEFLRADLIIYNPDLIQKIKNGEVLELSPAYNGEIIKESGRYNGTDYEYIQTIKSVNHLAVVEKGRSGYELRIQDSKFKKGVDEMALKMQDFLKSLRLFADELQEAEKKETQDEGLNKESIVREIMALSAKPDSEFAGGEAEKVETIAKFAEKLAYKEDSQTEVKDTEDSKVCDNEEVKDEDFKVCDNETEVKDSEFNAETAKELLEAISALIDSKIQNALRIASESEAKEARLIQDSYNEVSRVLGMQFDKTGKSVSDIYRFGYECLTKDSLPNGIDSKSAFAVVSKNKISQTQQVVTQDSAAKSDILEALNKMGGLK